MTLAFCTLMLSCILTIGGCAYSSSGRADTQRVGIGTLFWAMVFGPLEVIAAFTMANATGSSLLMFAAWVTLLLDIIGLVTVGLNYGKIYNPYLWYLWFMILLNAALIILYTHAYMAAS